MSLSWLLPHTENNSDQDTLGATRVTAATAHTAREDKGRRREGQEDGDQGAPGELSWRLTLMELKVATV